METNLIVFNNRSYKILQTLYRTIGSHQQILTTIPCNRTEYRRTFYVVEHSGQLFWVKEYTEPDYGHSIIYEFEETSRLCKSTIMGKNEIRTVKMVVVQRNRLLMEYCDGYIKLADMQLTRNQRELVSKLIRKWIDEHDVHDYDLCGNNILIKIGDYMSIRLIDFEYSVGVNHQRWARFLKE